MQCRRDEYATANDVVKKNLSAEIMRLERQVELDASTLGLMEYEIRKLELKKLHR